MQSGKPMDRLVCGDVGFGKTEVALRAAFVAVADGKQVACCARPRCSPNSTTRPSATASPTGREDRRSCRASRPPRNGAGAEGTGRRQGRHRHRHAQAAAEGRRFARLGLVIIDEEHRFGVRQKEALKALRAEVDVLTLTATPIPRTLAMSLEGLRDFSVIATAPQKRLAIKTFVVRFSDGIIREAVLREFKRGGQVYFLHNEVDTIENMRAKLEAAARGAHRRRPRPDAERELERVMRDFTQQRFNLLLCTTIIETGIDNPHANTILINRADRFGLAQLHQLRGRVGRSHHQAYAYLLTDANARSPPPRRRSGWRRSR
jgi:transcription-repair coupling factor (superfamily II helicase)